MRKLLIIPLILLAAFTLSAQTYPPEGWTADVREAIRIAEQEEKQILFNFTGSDWCVWCERLRDEVFDTDDFRNYAEENMVLLFIDSPRGIELPEQQIEHNQILAAILGVEGFPTLFLLDHDLTPLLRTGYRQGGAEAYLEHLVTDRPFELTDTQIAEFRTAFRGAIEEYIGEI